MTLEEFTNLSYADLKKLDTPTLKKLVSEKGKSLNKRIKRIEKDPEASQVSVDIVEKSGGRFKVGGKDRKALLAEAKREQRFARGKASTVRSARKHKEELQRAGAGMTAKEYGKHQKKQYIREQEQKIRNKTGKAPTKAQKKSIREKAKSVEAQARKELDMKVAEYWANFHKWQEANPEKGSPTNVKNNVSSRAFKSEEEQRSRFTKLYEKEVGKREKSYIEQQQSEDWTTTESTPFDVVKETVPPTPEDIEEFEEIRKLIEQTGGIPLT